MHGRETVLFRVNRDVGRRFNVMFYGVSKTQFIFRQMENIAMFFYELIHVLRFLRAQVLEAQEFRDRASSVAGRFGSRFYRK